MARRKTDIKSKDYNALDRAEKTLPIDWYYDPQHYASELRSVWSRHWVYLCRAEALADAGEFRTLSIGSQNVFVLRTDAGNLAAYFNSCRHRGSLLLTEAEGKLRSRSLNCPYHKWCYAVDDGRLLATTSFAEPDSFDKADFSLFPVAVHTWRGFVFVNLDARAEWNTSEVFAHGFEEVQNFPLEDLRVGHCWTKQLACNWKTFWDNYSECLHCPTVHPELAELVPIYKRGLLDQKDRPDWREHAGDPDPKYRGGLRPGAETFSTDGSAQGYARLEGLTDEDIARGVTFTGILPSIYLVSHADHARTVRILPRGPEATELTVEWLFPEDALQDPQYDRSNVTRFSQTILEQDGAVCELNQRGMRAGPMTHGVLMPEEYDLKSFRDWLLAALGR